MGLAKTWSTILKVTSVFQVHKRRRDVELEIDVDQASVARENEGEPSLEERQECRDAGGDAGGGTC